MLRPTKSRGYLTIHGTWAFVSPKHNSSTRSAFHCVRRELDSLDRHFAQLLRQEREARRVSATQSG